MNTTAVTPKTALGARPGGLPRGRYLDLPDRGRTFVREIEGPPGAPVVVLHHGWMASGALNWMQVFSTLGEHYRVIAPDTRGHARGLRTRRVFRLADCADDTAAMLDELGIDQAIVAGYSMGGPISQLLWRRHPTRVQGLVLAATSAGFMPGSRERIAFTTMMAALVGTTRAGSLASHLPGLPARVRPILATGRVPHWAATEFRRHDLRMVLEAGHSISTYHARWIHEVDVPTSIVLTKQDKAVAPQIQAEMAEAIAGATVHEIEDGHIVCAKPSFTAPFVAAIDDVAARVRVAV